MKTPQELHTEIVAAHAVPLKKGYRIEVELTLGERIVIKKKSNKAPQMVQLHTSHVNGNASWTTEGTFFTFAKSVHRFDKENHLAGYPVRVAG